MLLWIYAELETYSVDGNNRKEDGLKTHLKAS